MNYEQRLVAYLDRRMGAHRGAWPEHQWQCPACLDRRGDESTGYKFGFNFEKYKGFCFRCEFSVGSLKQLLMTLTDGKLTNEEMGLLAHEPEARGVVAGTLHAAVLCNLFHRSRTMRKLLPRPLPARCISLSESNDSAFFQQAREYLLTTRKLRPEDIDTYDLRFCWTGEYAHRIIFPVMQHGEIVYWTNRAIDPENAPKTKNPPNRPNMFTRDDCLYNFDACVGKKRVAIAEGPISVIQSARVCPTVGLLGKRMSDAQFDLIRELVARGTEEIVLAKDFGATPDDLLERLGGCVPRVTYLPLECGDPDDNRDRLCELYQHTRTLCVSDRVRNRLAEPKWGRRIFSCK